MPKGLRNIALDIGNTSFIENYRISAFHGVIRYAREYTNWQLIFNVYSFSLTNKFTDIESLKDAEIDGLIFISGDDEKLNQVKQLDIPAVSITNSESEIRFPSSVSDDFAVGRIAAEHLIERGFRNFAYCGSSETLWSRQRLVGFREKLAEHQLTCHTFAYEELLDLDPTFYQDTADGLRKWLSTLPRPLAVFGEHDTRALHVLEACRDLNYSVPNEVAILGVDNNQIICDSLVPSISSVEQNAERVGYEAAALLARILQGQARENEQVIVPPKGIVTRMSTDILAVDDPYVASALLYMRDNLAEQIGINDIVKAVGISRSNLEARFRKRLHTTINNELRNRRLKLAMSLLLDTMMPLEEIAQATGFRRATYFSNTFTQHVGVAPGLWRRQQHGQF